MKITFYFTLLFSLFYNAAFSQSYEKPYIESVGDRICFITKVELTEQYTIISFEHLNNNGWIRLSKGIQIKTPDNKEYSYIKSEGITIAPENYEFKKGEKKHAFTVYFQPLPKNTNVFDVLEVQPGSRFDFNFYGVDLRKKRTSDEQTAHFKDEASVKKEIILSDLPPSFMQHFGEVYKDIYKSSIDTYINYLKQPDKLKELAQLSKAYYDALVAEGFTKEQALQILISAPLIPQGAGNK